MTGWFGLTQPFGYGKGYQHPLTATSPAAGSSFSVNLSAQYRWRYVSCVFTLTADGNAANRYVTLEYQGGDGKAILVDAAAVVVTASSTQRFCGSISRTVAEWAANTDVLFPMTPAFLDGGGVLTINVTNIQAGDTLTLIRFIFDRFSTAPDVETAGVS